MNNQFLTLSALLIALLSFSSCTQDTSDQQDFAPVITSFTPSSGVEGSTIVLTGSHFSTTPSKNVVKINGVVATVTAATRTQLTIVVPANVTSGKITVEANGKTAISSTDFIVTPSMRINSFTPDHGEPGSTVTINGTGFSSPMEVIFNGTTVAATDIISVSATAISFKVPASATSGTIKVKKGTTELTAGNFTVTNIWVAKNNTGLGSGYNQAVSFVYNNKIYLGLGDANNGAPFVFHDDFQVYDPATNAWSKDVAMSKGPIPNRRFATATVNNGKVYIGTGTDGSNTQLKDWWAYDFTTNSWSSKADITYTSYADVSFTLNGKSYVGLGTGDDMFIYDPATNSWSSFKPGAPYRTDGGSFVINNVAYFGGGSSTLGTDFYKIDAGVSATTATPIASIPERSFRTGFALNGKGYMVTGNNKLYEYDPSTNSWAERAMPPVAVGYAQTANGHAYGITYDGKVYEYIANY